MRTTVLHRACALAALLALAACGGAGEDAPAPGEAERFAFGADPAVTSALEDQILIDPNLVQQAHPNAVRPPEMPVQAQYPAGSATAAAGEGCAEGFERGRQWTGRLPGEFALYPGARVTEAGGRDAEDCRLRFVAFRTSDSHAQVIEHYRGLARRAGFSAEHRQRGADHVLGGVHPGSDRAFVLVVTPVERGSEAAFVVDGGP